MINNMIDMGAIVGGGILAMQLRENPFSSKVPVAARMVGLGVAVFNAQQFLPNVRSPSRSRESALVNVALKALVPFGIYLIFSLRHPRFEFSGRQVMLIYGCYLAVVAIRNYLYFPAVIPARHYDSGSPVSPSAPPGLSDDPLRFSDEEIKQIGGRELEARIAFLTENPTLVETYPDLGLRNEDIDDEMACERHEELLPLMHPDDLQAFQNRKEPPPPYRDNI